MNSTGGFLYVYTKYLEKNKALAVNSLPTTQQDRSTSQSHTNGFALSGVRVT